MLRNLAQTGKIMVLLEYVRSSAQIHLHPPCEACNMFYQFIRILNIWCFERWNDSWLFPSSWNGELGIYPESKLMIDPIEARLIKYAIEKYSIPGCSSPNWLCWSICFKIGWFKTTWILKHRKYPESDGWNQSDDPDVYRAPGATNTRPHLYHLYINPLKEN